jgi:tRNA/rRNA methyltransferase/tRNA (cytidine32/uridine32-2'-O)-methyltransferase
MLLDHVVVVLYEPQDPVNIAATVRAMKNMGIQTLRLVDPVTYDAERIEGIAHDTADVVAGIRHFESLDAALADCVHIAAFTRRRRAAKRASADARQTAQALLAYATAGPVAILFGREDHGLPNEALDRAHIVSTIPTTDHASLNLAQAVLIALYELHLAAGDATRTIDPPKHDAPLATAAEFELFFADAERALVAIDFFKTRYPEHILRSIRSLAHRAGPDSREITLLRAAAIEVVRSLERVAKRTSQV